VEMDTIVNAVVNGVFGLLIALFSYYLGKRQSKEEKYRRRYAGALMDLLAFYRLEEEYIGELKAHYPPGAETMELKRKVRAAAREKTGLRVSRYASPTAIDDAMREMERGGPDTPTRN